MAVNIIKCSSQLIHTEVEVLNGGKKFFCSFIYGLNSRQERMDLWKDLKDIKMNDAPWVIMGDFNSIMRTDERVGQPVRTREIMDMLQCMEECNLNELKTSGQFYTWNNKQEGIDRVFCKLDRALGNESWFEQWPNTEIITMPEGEYDHCPLLVKSFQNELKKKPFRFFNMWCQAPEFQDIVKKVWQQPVRGCKMYQIVSKLKALKKDLRVLNSTQFGDVSVKHTQTYQNMIHWKKELQLNPHDLELRHKEQDARKDYSEAHKQYSAFLSQKAKLRWITEGDDNTRAFHQSIKQRRMQIVE
ncbi:uncharacterized protein LOC130589545 [Beta vulgaris subsp. vulgaris]|uniref:uncharacterized protein LOC130589545 n=1 Tax=Beta vulgaris subsp. vulgaris TaxID=3555 RepID=UPI00254807B9|nr:uncharacterized protein LOC130589545 [Beta vulgaris subsp. vulgaris]